MFTIMDFFPSHTQNKAYDVYPAIGNNSNFNPNAGNFQEYTYELEWMECHWNHVYKCIDMVTAYWYPWIDRNALHKMYPDLNN